MDASNLEQMDLSTAGGSKVWVGFGKEACEGFGTAWEGLGAGRNPFWALPLSGSCGLRGPSEKNDLEA